MGQGNSAKVHPLCAWRKPTTSSLTHKTNLLGLNLSLKKTRKREFLRNWSLPPFSLDG
jgi:hypothetical protein